MAEDAAQLLPVVYARLRTIAGSYLRGQEAQTLQTTAVVHEAFLRMARSDQERFVDRNHFLAVAAIAMRQVLIDSARRRTARKRGGGLQRVTFEGPAVIDRTVAAAETVLAVDAALKRLAELSPRQARVVELTYFGGLSAEEASRSLGISVSLVEKECRRARAWLRRELEDAA